MNRRLASILYIKPGYDVHLGSKSNFEEAMLPLENPHDVVVLTFVSAVSPSQCFWIALPRLPES